MQIEQREPFAKTGFIMNEDEVDYPQRMRIEWYKDKTADINLAEKQTGGKRKENECE